MFCILHEDTAEKAWLQMRNGSFILAEGTKHPPGRHNLGFYIGFIGFMGFEGFIGFISLTQV